MLGDMVSIEQLSTLRRTALHGTHHAHKARMVDFGGWDMPVQYAGLVAEHTAVRTGWGSLMYRTWAISSCAGQGRWRRCSGC